jgi:AbrB family looped-hinge helix DNA binding protein
MPRKKVGYQARDHLVKEIGDGKIAEAALEYIVGGQGEDAMTTISSKNQITLPAHLLREMGLGAGDRLAIAREGTRLVLRARPRDWVAYHAGSLAGHYGDSKEEQDAYLQDLRRDEARELAIERAWSGTEPAPKR